MKVIPSNVGVLYRISIGILMLTLCTPATGTVDEELQTQYATEVRAGRLYAAIDLACRYYGLPCAGASFKIGRDQNRESYSDIGLSNVIYLYGAAFSYPDLPLPHPGWLAATIGHELIHLEQGRFGRLYSQLARIYGGTHYYIAARELEAWQWMFDNARDLDLTCSMYFEVEDAREHYEWTLQHGGVPPPNGIIPGNRIAKFQRLKDECRQWN